MTIKSEIQSLEPSALITLYVLDTTMFTGGEISRFHSGISQVNRPIVWQGETYLPVPLKAEGFDLSTQGALPRPKLYVANVGGFISAMCEQMEDLIGAKVTRKQTYARYLDAVNFPKGNPNANPNQYLPDQMWYVARKTAETNKQVDFELSSAFDLDGVKLPLRQMIKNTCCWRYRSAECGYTGGYVDKNNQPTSDINQDICLKKLEDCKARHGLSNNLPYGGFPGAIRND